MYRPLLALCALAFPLLASANVMTFEALDPFPVGDRTYTEDGITAFGVLGGLNERSQGWIHVDRIGQTGSFADFSMADGGDFLASSIDLRPNGSGYCDPANSSCRQDDPFQYIWISGFLDDVLMGSASLYRPQSDVFATIGLEFLGTIDLLRIEAKSWFDLGGPGRCFPPCGHFEVDNVRLQPVPEPATLSLLAIGVLGALGARRRRAA